MMRSNYPAQVGHSTAPRAPIPIPAKPIDPGIREGSSQRSKAGSCARIHAVKTRPLNLGDQLEERHLDRAVCGVSCRSTASEWSGCNCDTTARALRSLLSVKARDVPESNTADRSVSVASVRTTAQITMQLRRVIVALALAAGAAFTLPTRRQAMQPRRAADEVCGECDPMSPFSDGCRPCADGRSVFVGDTKVTSKTLRDIDVVSANGNRVRLDDLMGRKASVVVFLRHLG